jgi:hypothetical protein
LRWRYPCRWLLLMSTPVRRVIERALKGRSPEAIAALSDRLGHGIVLIRDERSRVLGHHFGAPVDVSAASVEEDSGGIRRADRRTNLVAPIKMASAAMDSHANTSPTMA